MYKCLNCGNTEKFIGYAEEKGKAYIYQDPSKNSSKDSCQDCCSWVYMISDNSWKGSINIYKCFYCNSKKIIKI
jgi:hypothetical protein